MSFPKSRTVTLAVAGATLTSNILSSLLFHQLPDDPYHLAGYFGWYLHFANVLSLCGFVGALKQHAPSIAIFANYLLLDTLLCSMPRLLVLTLLQTYTSTLCTPSYASPTQTSNPLTLPSDNDYAALSYGFENQIGQLTEGWTLEGCVRIVWLAQLTLMAGILAATLLQFVGALCVREYARSLWIREGGVEWEGDSVLTRDEDESDGRVKEKL